MSPGPYVGDDDIGARLACDMHEIGGDSQVPQAAFQHLARRPADEAHRHAFHAQGLQRS
jgi:hypothetical protein